LLPAVPKPPANAVDLGLEELAAAGQLGMDNIQIPGMTAEACKPGKQLKGLAPKQVQVQRAIVAAKQHRHQEKQQYKQLQETLAREEEARRATRAAELEAAQQERIEKQQKERQQVGVGGQRVFQTAGTCFSVPHLTRVRHVAQELLPVIGCLY
jgi:hypothetical protein